MIIDFHTHIFPKQIRASRDAYFHSEPDFKLLYSRPKSKMAGVQELVDTMDAQQVDASVVFGFPWKNPETVKIHNDYVRLAADQHPGRLIPFCCLDPLNNDAVFEAERCLENGFAGIGEIAVYQSGFDEFLLNRLAPIMEISRKKNNPVLIHTNEPVGHLYHGKAPMTFNQIFNLIKTFQNNQIVLAHWGGGIFFFNLAKKEVKEYLKNVYFDTAASPFLYDSAIYKIASQIIGASKIFFGSDFPLIKPEKYFSEMKASGLSDEDVENICGGNAVRLLNF